MKIPVVHPKDAIRAAARAVLPSLIAFGIVACGGGSSSGDSSSTSTTFTVGGVAVIGLNETVTLQLNGGNTLPVSGTGTPLSPISFTFSGALAGGSSYNVTVISSPAGQTCTVYDGVGSEAGQTSYEVTNVNVICTEGTISTAGVHYSVTTLGPLAAGSSTSATAINDDGQITGATYYAGTFDASLYSNGTITDLGNLGGIDLTLSCQCDEYSYPLLPGTQPWFAGTALLPLSSISSSVGNAINGNGEVVGWSYTQSGESGSVDAFLYTDGAMVDLGPYVGTPSEATGINDNGYVIGYSPVSAESWIYCIPSSPCGSGIQALGTLGAVVPTNGPTPNPLCPYCSGYLSEVVAINDRDQLAGNITYDAAGDYMAILYDSTAGDVVQLGTLGGNSSWATAINANNVVVGCSSTSESDVYLAFLNSGADAASGKAGDMTDLGSLGDDLASCAYGINSSEEVVGSAIIASDTALDVSSFRAFLYKNSAGTMYDLNNLIDPQTSATILQVLEALPLTSAIGINDAGQIVATNGTEVYLLTPEQ